MDTLEDQYQQYTEVISEEELRRLAGESWVVEQRARRLPLRILFWLIVLSAGQPTVRGARFQLVAFFVASLSGLFPMAQTLTLTKMALSHKLKDTNWFFLRGVYNRLLVRYRELLPPSKRRLVEAFQDTFILDVTNSRVHKALKKVLR